MIKIENTSVTGWDAAIRGMRNPKNSWDRSDSTFEYDYDFGEMVANIGPNDLKLMKTLAKSGSDHRKFLRMITVYADITAPLYWWKEFDTYKVGTVANSCSTMHKLMNKEFTYEDFSFENCIPVLDDPIDRMVDMFNVLRELYLTAPNEKLKKQYWYSLVQILPSSYNQKRTVMLNYEVLKNMYRPDARLHHKLDEWSVDGRGESLCKWIETLPHSELITGKE